MNTSFLSNNRLVLAAAVVAVGALAVWKSGMLDAKDHPLTAPPEVAAELKKPGPLPELVLGRADAPVTIVEYADLTCPHCAAFHAKVLPLVKEKYIDTGKARLVFREFPLNIYSLIAYMSVRCAGPEAAFPLLGALFAHQEEWVKAKSAKELADNLFPYAQQSGLTREAFDACVPSGDELTTDRQKQLFKDIGAVGEHAVKAFAVNATPTFFVNGRRLPGPAIEDFDTAIEAALGGK